MSVILSILRLLLAFAAVLLASGADADVVQRVSVGITLREGDRSVLDTELPVAWGVRTGGDVVRADGFIVDLLATRTRIAGGPAADITMLVRRGQGAQMRTVWVPRLTLGCSGRAAVTLDRPDEVTGPLHLTLAIDPAAIDPSCAKP